MKNIELKNGLEEVNYNILNNSRFDRVLSEEDEYQYTGMMIGMNLD